MVEASTRTMMPSLKRPQLSPYRPRQSFILSELGGSVKPVTTRKIPAEMAGEAGGGQLGEVGGVEIAVVQDVAPFAIAETHLELLRRLRGRGVRRVSNAPVGFCPLASQMSKYSRHAFILKNMRSPIRA